MKTAFDMSACHRQWRRCVVANKMPNFLQREIENRLFERLLLLKNKPRRILNWGLFNDEFGEKLRGHFQQTEVVTLNIVENVDWLMSLPEGLQVDWVVSNLTLHWSMPYQYMLQAFFQVLATNGMMIFTMLGRDTLCELRDSFASALNKRRHTHVHDFPDMHELGDLLLAAGFVDPVMDMQVITTWYRNLSVLWRDLRDSGGANCRCDRLKGLLSQSVWQSMLSHYKTLAQDDQFPVTAEIIYGHAWAPSHTKPFLSSSASQGEVYIPVDTIPIR